MARMARVWTLTAHSALAATAAVAGPNVNPLADDAAELAWSLLLAIPRLIV
jgi:hypothetical protein